MPSGLSARTRFLKTPSEVRNVRVGLKDLLDTGELLTGTPTITVSPSGLTVSSPAVNSTTLVIDNETYVAGQAVTFVISSGTAGTLYQLTITVSSDDSQTFERYVYVLVQNASSSTGEPTVGGDYDEIRRVMGDFLAKSLDPDDWSQNDFDRIEGYIASGYRRMLQPPPIRSERVSHRWSFLKPIGTLTIWGDVSGTMSGVPTYTSAAGTSSVTATASVFYETMVGKTITFTTSGTSYTVAGFTSGTVITLTGDASGETSGDTFTVYTDGDYQLADSFGGLDGDIFFASSDNAWRSMKMIDFSRILFLRQNEHTVITNLYTPEYGCIMPINSTSTSEGQRWKLMVWPEMPAGESRTCTFRFHALQDAISLLRPYALGGAAHFETLLESCLAVAEERHNDMQGVHKQAFLERLEASVHHDRALFQAKSFGTMTDPGMDRDYNPWRETNPVVSFDGVQPS